MTTPIVIDLIAIGAVLAVLAGIALPLSRAIRIRNAFLFEPGSPADFEWKPSAMPADFRQECAPASPEFVSAVDRLGIAALPNDWSKALALAAHLAEHARDRGPIRADLHTMYRMILEGYGYCSDFTKVYLALCHAAGLSARQWGFSFDGFGGHGHAVIEVFDHQRDRWVFLDVYNNFHALDSQTREPLSALQVRDSVLGVRPEPLIQQNGPGRPGWEIEEERRDYYRRGANDWYLWWGNAVFSQDKHPVVRGARLVSGRLAPIAGTFVGQLPRIRVLRTRENAPIVERLVALKRRVIWLVIALVLLALFAALVVNVGFGTAVAEAGA